MYDDDDDDDDLSKNGKNIVQYVSSVIECRANDGLMHYLFLLTNEITTFPKYV
jgi:hypothetical protein